MHCNVIKSLGGEQNGSDDLLQESIKVWKHANENSTDLVTKATTTAVLYVAKHLLLIKQSCSFTFGVQSICTGLYRQ